MRLARVKRPGSILQTNFATMQPCAALRHIHCILLYATVINCIQLITKIAKHLVNMGQKQLLSEIIKEAPDYHRVLPLLVII
jgi:hypothetical protein